VSKAVHEIGAPAECGVHYAGHKIGATAEYGVQCACPVARSPGDASAGDQIRPAVFAARGRARIDPGLKTGPRTMWPSMATQRASLRRNS
jgi:hypothetical protein